MVEGSGGGDGGEFGGHPGHRNHDTNAKKSMLWVPNMYFNFDSFLFGIYRLWLAFAAGRVGPRILRGPAQIPAPPHTTGRGGAP